MTTRRRWGKAGQRLTEGEAARIDARRNQARERRARYEQIAHRKWAAGLLVPYRITVALDAADLHGPDVDAACNAAEPEVDMWEAAKLYPRWDQVVALAELTGKTPRWFMNMPEPLPMHTSLRFHMPKHVWMPEPILRYSDTVVHATVGGDGL